MIESPVLQEFYREALAEGEAKGKAEGKAEGKVEGKAEAILRVLRARFGTVPSDLESGILAIHDDARLDALLERAACAESLDIFQSSFDS